MASVRAKPSHWIEVISSRISGWRVTDSMTLPKMKPTPTPGPTVPRPAPTPSAIARSPLAGASSDAAAGGVGTSPRSTVAPLVLLGDRAAEIDRGESGEDEGLQRGHEAHFEEEEGHGHDDRDGAQRREPKQHDEAAGHEEDEQMPGEDVREESDAQRDDPHEVRDDLDREDRDARGALDAGRDPGLQVADRALGPDALEVVAEPHDQRQDQRHRDVGGRRPPTSRCR